LETFSFIRAMNAIYRTKDSYGPSYAASLIVVFAAEFTNSVGGHNLERLFTHVRDVFGLSAGRVRFSSAVASKSNGVMRPEDVIAGRSDS